MPYFGVPTRNGLPLGLGTVASLASRATAAVVSVTDAFFRYVSLLLNTSATNGAQNNTFLDSSTNNFSITRNGNTTQGTFSPFSQTGWSNYFDGTGDQLNLSVSAISGAGSSNFSIECWVYAQRQTNTFVQGLVSYGIAGSSTGTSYLSFELNAAGNLSVAYAQASTSTLTDSTLFPINQWVHAVVCRSGSTLSLFVNGSRVATATTSATVGSTGDTLTVGGQWFANASTRQLQGYISNARIVNGASAYDATLTTLTVPTSPLTAITNTSLLTCQSNRFIDNSSNAFAITPNGDVSVQAFSPFNPTAAWSAGTNGGSGYFDGAGDTLVTPSITIGTNAFCFECWFYPTVTQGAIAGIFVAVTNDGLQCSYYDATGSGGLGIAQKGVAWQIFNSNGVKPTVNQWNHIAFVRSGTGTNQTSIFLNGTRVANGTVSFNYVASNYELSTTLATGTVLQGYVGSSRLTIGSSPYDATLTTLTVPTSLLTNITNTSLLLNFTNAGIFDSASGNDLETVGNAQVSTTQAKFGTTSMGFDGTGDWIPKADRPPLRLGTADFTIEGWVYLNAAGVAYGLISKGAASTGWSVNVTSGNKLQFSYTATQLTGATSLAASTWYHFAVVRSGSASGNLKVYLNGTADATSAGAVTDDFNQTNIMYVGADRVAGSSLNGYLDEVRITNGIARYTSNFTPPTEAFPLN